MNNLQKNILPLITALFLCFFLAVTAFAASKAQQKKAFDIFEASLNVNLEKGTALTKKAASLKKLDINKELENETYLNLRLRFANTYLAIDDFRNAAEYLYAASLKTSTMAPRLKQDLYKSLTTLWSKKGSDISAKFNLYNYLRVTGRKDIDPFVFYIFLKNNLLQKSDYYLLKKLMSSSHAAPNEDAYIFSKVAIKFDDPREAQRYLLQIPDDSSLGAEKQYSLGTVFVKLRNLDKAMSHFKKCLELIENNQKAKPLLKDASIMALARVLSHMEKWKEASVNYERISQDSFFYNQALFELSYTNFKDNNYKKSIESLDYLLINQPEINLFLDAMKIRGRQFIPGSYLQMAMNAYKELLDRMQYERAKLEYTIKNFSGSEDKIIPVVSSLSMPTTINSIPSVMMVKALSTYKRINRLGSLMVEISELEEELNLSTLMINHMKRTVAELNIMPSLEKTKHWLNSRKADSLRLILNTSQSLVNLSKDLELGSLPLNSDKIQSLRDALPSPEWKGCSDERLQISHNILEYRTISKDILDLFDKINHMNELTLSGWKIMDGGREKIALSLNKKITSEYSNLKTIKRESIMDYLNLRLASYQLDDICSQKTSKALDRLISSSLSNLSDIEGKLDSKIKATLSLNQYTKTKKALTTARNMRAIVIAVNRFEKRLNTTQNSTIQKLYREIRQAEVETEENRKQLETLKNKFMHIAKPGVKLAFSKAKVSFKNYIESYGWGFVSSQFEMQKETKRRLKRLHIAKENEIRRIDNDFKLISNEE